MAGVSVQAGRYLVAMSASCSARGSGSPLCQQYVAPFDTFTEGVVLQCQTNGHCAYTANYTAFEHHPSAPATCRATLFVKPFNGSCWVIDTGNEIVKRGMTGLSDFWITSETVRVMGHPGSGPIHNPLGAAAYPLDLGIPAVPGVYTDRTLARLTGKRGEVGVRIVVVISRV